MSALSAVMHPYFPRPLTIPGPQREAGHQQNYTNNILTGGLEIISDHKVHGDQGVQDGRVDQQVSVDTCGGWHQRHSRCQVAPYSRHFLDQRCKSMADYSN